MVDDDSRLNAVLEAIDHLNSADPRSDWVHETEVPRELLYGQRMSERLAQYAQEASEELQIAVRAQHVRRWVVPRDKFPAGRDGYRAWRTALGQYHAQVAAEVMADKGYDQARINRVGSLIRKENFKRDSEAQALEDIACLVFLEYYLEEFMAAHPPEKVIDIIRKTWGKMSPLGQSMALKLELSPEVGAVVRKALARA